MMRFPCGEWSEQWLEKRRLEEIAIQKEPEAAAEKNTNKHSIPVGNLRKTKVKVEQNKQNI